MANVLSHANIIEGQIVEAHHISQSINAFTGVEAYDISLSGSFNMTGSINGQPTLVNPLTASYAMTASIALNAINLSPFPFNGNAEIIGSLNVLGSSTFEGPVGGLNNTAIGTNALADNLTGANNIAIGTNALADNLTGANNIVIGENALAYNLTGANNIAIGTNTLFNNDVNSNQIAIGSDINDNALQTIALGHEITISEHNVLHIGSATHPIGTLIGNPPTGWQVYINDSLVIFVLE